MGPGNERVLTMSLETAIKLLREEYEKAKGLKFVRNPLAYALHRVWRRADNDAEIDFDYEAEC